MKNWSKPTMFKSAGILALLLITSIHLLGNVTRHVSNSKELGNIITKLSSKKYGTTCGKENITLQISGTIKDKDFDFSSVHAKSLTIEPVPGTKRAGFSNSLLKFSTATRTVTFKDQDFHNSGVHVCMADNLIIEGCVFTYDRSNPENTAIEYDNSDNDSSLTIDSTRIIGPETGHITGLSCSVGTLNMSNVNFISALLYIIPFPNQSRKMSMEDCFFSAKNGIDKIDNVIDISIITDTDYDLSKNININHCSFGNYKTNSGFINLDVEAPKGKLSKAPTIKDCDFNNDKGKPSLIFWDNATENTSLFNENLISNNPELSDPESCNDDKPYVYCLPQSYHNNL